jgi:hypothetical protein
VVVDTGRDAKDLVVVITLNDLWMVRQRIRNKNH